MGFAAESMGRKACYTEERKGAASVLGTHGRTKTDGWVPVDGREGLALETTPSPPIPLSRAQQISSVMDQRSCPETL